MLTQIIDEIKKRQTLLTIFTVLIILFGGIQIIDNPEQWWIAPVALLGILAIIIIFMYFKVIFKALISFIVMSFTTYYAFVFGVYGFESNVAVLSETWAMSITVVWFFNLALSYMLQSTRSRWSTMAIATIIQFICTLLTIGLFDNPHTSIALSALIGIIAFITIFTLGTFFSYRKSTMPSNIASDILTSNLREEFEKEGWGFRDLRKKGNKGGYLVFKEKAYYIYPVRMMQEFSVWKKGQLRYQNKRVDKWLASVAFKEIPTWRSRFSPIMPVLLDISNANGSQGKIIGVELPDTKKQMPFGIFPGRELNSNSKNKSTIIENFEKRFDGFINPISEKQKNSLTKISQRDVSRDTLNYR